MFRLTVAWLLVGVAGCAPCAEPECAACFADRDAPDRATWVEAVDAAASRADALEAALAERCRVMSSHLGIDAPAGLDGCGAAAAEVEDRVGRFVTGGVRLVIASEPVICHAPLDHACVAGCGAVAACDGPLVGECPGRCDGECHGACEETCRGTCSDFCEGACDGRCAGECDGDCAVRDAWGGCVGMCAGDCVRGACDGECDGACTGVCTSACDGACSGACVGECDVEWTPRCAGRVSLGDDPCAHACALAIAVDTACDLPEVRVRGPELEDPRSHGLVDQAVLSLHRGLPEVLQIRARAAALRAALDAAAPHLAAEAQIEGGECLGPRDAATADLGERLGVLVGLADAIVTAAQDTTGAAPP